MPLRHPALFVCWCILRAPAVVEVASVGLSSAVAEPAAHGFPACSCPDDPTLCRPRPRRPTSGQDVHVYSDCGGPWMTASKAGNSSCDWRQFDFDTITTIVRMAGHPLSVAADGQVIINKASHWPDSDLLCHAHAHDVRVVAVVLPGGSHVLHGTGNSHPDGYYHALLSNRTAISRMATELVEAVEAAGFDGVEFDFESMSAEAIDFPSFDYGTAHVDMIKAVKAAFNAAPSATGGSVTLTMGAANLTDEVAKPYLACYPIPGLAEASDGIFIMAYDMWHHHQVCAGPNSPLPDVNASIQSFLELGVAADKLILGMPFYGYEYRCNDSFATPSTFAPCSTSTCVVGDLQHYSSEHYGTGAWSIERYQDNMSTGCVKHWSNEWSSPYLDCPASTFGPFPGFGARGGAPAQAAKSQTWYDDANSTKLKVELACELGLGGVGAFTAENIGAGVEAAGYWEALGSIARCPNDSVPAVP